MDDYNYTELFRLQSAELAGGTPFCPEDQEIAEYFDGDLAQAESTRLERHLADCRFCLARIGILERLEDSRISRRIPEAVLATAKKMAHRVPGRRPGLAPAWAAAAVVVIALFTIVSRNQESIPESGTASSVAPSTEESSRQLRTVNRVATDLDVLTPAPGADIYPGSLIQWAEVPNNVHYNIFVVSTAGDVLWTERVAGTEWVLQEALHLAAGGEYYFRVEAQLPDGRRVSSKSLAFRVAERQ
jgi:hypothetical protein